MCDYVIGCSIEKDRTTKQLLPIVPYSCPDSSLYQKDIYHVISVIIHVQSDIIVTVEHGCLCMNKVQGCRDYCDDIEGF